MVWSVLMRLFLYLIRENKNPWLFTLKKWKAISMRSLRRLNWWASASIFFLAFRSVISLDSLPLSYIIKLRYDVYGYIWLPIYLNELASNNVCLTQTSWLKMTSHASWTSVSSIATYTSHRWAGESSSFNIRRHKMSNCRSTSMSIFFELSINLNG